MINETLRLIDSGINYSIQYLNKYWFSGSIILIIAGLIIAKGLSYIYEKTLLRFAEKSTNKIDDILAQELKGPIFYITFLFFIHLSIIISKPSEKIMLYTSNTFKSIYFLIASVIIYRFINAFIDNYGEKIASKTKTDFDDALIPLMKNLMRVLFLGIAVMEILSIWNINITPLLASAGIAGFAIAFASKDLISHFFGGVSVYVDKVLKKGDRVSINDGPHMFVEEVGIRSTKFLTLDGTRVIIPNADIANTKIENFSLPSGKKPVKIDVGVSYDSDIDLVKKTLIDIAKKNELIIDNPEPKAILTTMADSALIFKLICYVKDLKDLYTAKFQLNEAIIKEFRKKGIEIPYPHMTVELKKNK